MNRFVLLILFSYIVLAGHGVSHASGLPDSIANANCFYFGYAPFKNPERHTDEPKPIRNRVRLRIQVSGLNECQRIVSEYCRDILLADGRLPNLSGYFKVKAKDSSSRDKYYRFKARSDCSMESTSQGEEP